MNFAIDWLNFSVKAKAVDWDLFAKEILKTSLRTNLNPAWTFNLFQDQPGITIVTYDYANVEQIQLSGEFWQREDSFELSKRIKAWLLNYSTVNLSRIDVCKYVSIEVSKIFNKNDLDFYSFKKNAGMKPFFVGLPLETVSLNWRHKKVRVYNKLAQCMHLVSKGLAKKHHKELLRNNLDGVLTRIEIELRSLHCSYADAVFDEATSTEELAGWVAEKFLIENPFQNPQGQEHKMWSLMRSGYFKKAASKKIMANKMRREEELRRAASFIKNKFEKYALTEKESLEFLLQAFGFIGPVDYIYLEENISLNELKAQLALAQLKRIS